jgi:DNA-binding transcriptional regulator YdaS (Cro superfamily)
MKANETRLALLLGSRDMKLADLAKSLRVNKTTVSRWAQKEIPTDRIEAVEKATGIPPHELRPDLASVFAPAETETAS